MKSVQIIINYISQYSTWLFLFHSNITNLYEYTTFATRNLQYCKTVTYGTTSKDRSGWKEIFMERKIRCALCVCMADFSIKIYWCICSFVRQRMVFFHEHVTIHNIIWWNIWNCRKRRCLFKWLSFVRCPI